MSLQDYDNLEEQAYRQMQKTLKMVAGEESAALFTMPYELCGWFYLRRSGLSPKDQTQIILNNGGSTKLESIRNILCEAYPPTTMDKYDRHQHANRPGKRANYDDHDYEGAN